MTNDEIDAAVERMRWHAIVGAREAPLVYSGLQLLGNMLKNLNDIAANARDDMRSRAEIDRKINEVLEH